MAPALYGLFAPTDTPSAPRPVRLLLLYLSTLYGLFGPLTPRLPKRTPPLPTAYEKKGLRFLPFLPPF